MCPGASTHDNTVANGGIWRHMNNTGANASFADGHVKAIKESQIPAEWSYDGGYFWASGKNTSAEGYF